MRKIPRTLWMPGDWLTKVSDVADSTEVVSGSESSEATDSDSDAFDAIFHDPVEVTETDTVEDIQPPSPKRQRISKSRPTIYRTADADVDLPASHSPKKTALSSASQLTTDQTVETERAEERAPIRRYPTRSKGVRCSTTP